MRRTSTKGYTVFQTNKDLQYIWQKDNIIHSAYSTNSAAFFYYFGVYVPIIYTLVAETLLKTPTIEKASRCKVLGVYNTNHRMIIQRDGSIHSRNVTMYMNHMQKGSTIHVSAVEMLVQVHRQASSFIFSSKIELRLQCISLESFASLHLHYQHLFFNDQNMFSSTSFSYIGLARDDCITR